MPNLELQIWEGGRVLNRYPFEGTLELGRQDHKDPTPTSSNALLPVSGGTTPRLVIAPAAEKRISRKHVLIEPLGHRHVRLTNLSEARSVRLESGEELPKQFDKLETSLPVVMLLGGKMFRVGLANEPSEDDPLLSLAGQTVMPGANNFAGLMTLSQATRATGEGDVENLMRWIHAAMGVLHSAATSDDFFQRASKALVELVGLDSGRVLLREGDKWNVQATQRSLRVQGSEEWSPSRYILGRLMEEKRTFWKPLPTGNSMESLVSLETVVAAPVLDRDGNVIGALYGDRQRGLQGGLPRPITKMEALLVELLAGGVAAGLARLEQERVALKAQVQLENYFTPRLARILAEKPELLEGRDASVTVLVCDIRGFSRVTERLGPAVSFLWISDVMTALTECILKEDGVVVDYVGDEVMAMWGAPTEQTDHAQRAHRTGRAMIDRLPDLNAKWGEQLQGPMAVGIGIHSGPARVGNVGSTFRLKYGPLGNTVNLASRVQGINKYLNTQTLLTRATYESLDSKFSVRRLGKVRVVNIQEPVELFEPLADHQLTLQTLYEQALGFFEEKSFAKAAAILGRMLSEYPGDGPTLMLLSRTVQSLVSGPDKDHPVWALEGK